VDHTVPYVHFLDQKEYEQSEYKRALYALLKLFDQTAAYDESGHRLRILRTIFPNELDRLIKRLQSADSKEIEEQMNLEDEVFKDYYDLMRTKTKHTNKV